jgi:ABC-type microcin C transport system permease subunit YejE
MAAYWFNDNIQVLSALKVISWDAEKWNKRGMFCWWISLLLNVVQHIREIIQFDKELKYIKEEVKRSPEKKDSFNDKFKKAKEGKITGILNLVKALGDLLTATKGSGMADRLGLKFINDKLCGLGGSLSAVIFLYQTYKP